MLRPAGIAEIEGNRVDVVSEGGFVPVGQMIKVVKVEGSRIIVQTVDNS
jgi:membrane-bound serine protease (ClpP class)